MRSLARLDAHGEPIEAGEDSVWEARGEILVVKVVIQMRQDREARPERDDQFERLFNRLVRGVWQVAQRPT